MKGVITGNCVRAIPRLPLGSSWVRATIFCGRVETTRIRLQSCSFEFLLRTAALLSVLSDAYAPPLLGRSFSLLFAWCHARTPGIINTKGAIGKMQLIFS